MYTSSQFEDPVAELARSVAQETARVARVTLLNQKISDGNQVMADLVAALTPPVATGKCSDLKNSAAMHAISAYPNSVIIAPDGSGKPTVIDPSQVSVSKRLQIARKTPASSTK